MSRQQSIYDKLAKYSKAQDKPKTALSKKVNLKNHNVILSTFKIALNKLDDISEKIDFGGYNADYAEEVFMEGRSRIVDARDVMRFEFVEYEAALERLEEITDQLDEIGIPYPERIVELLEYSERIKDKFNENIQLFNDFGVNPMVDRMD